MRTEGLLDNASGKGELVRESEVSPEGEKRTRLFCDLEIQGNENFKRRIWSRVSFLRGQDE